MRTLAQLEEVFESPLGDGDPASIAASLLAASEEILEHWVSARDETPTDTEREGFRLLALHRQGTRSDPSFNACRETCREIAYHYNLVTMQPDAAETTNRLQMMQMVSKHLYLFITGKLQVAGLGEFCCSSRPIRTAPDNAMTTSEEA